MLDHKKFSKIRNFDTVRLILLPQHESQDKVLVLQLIEHLSHV